MKILLKVVCAFLLVPVASAQNMPTGGYPITTTGACNTATGNCVTTDGTIVTPAIVTPLPVGPTTIRTGTVDGGTTTTPLQVQPVPAAVPARQPSDFEKFVQDTLGHPLPVFGRNLFLNATAASFISSSNIPAPADYPVGPGDQIFIRAWGNIDINAPFVVDRNGQIFIPRVGVLTVSGLRADQLTDFIHAAIAQQFKDFQLTVTMGQLRSIQIFVTGQAMNPRGYTISSLSTLVNALFESGGPSPSGSLRDIQVKRSGKTIIHFDTYAFLLNGDNTADVHLLPGDIIDIPPVGPQVAIDGDVNTPAIYEMKTDATVSTGIDVAGGLTAVAEVAHATLERIVNHASRNIQDIALGTDGMRTPLKDGDILRVFPLTSKIDNAVTLRGNVANPGVRPWHPGMRVSDLIPNAESLITRAYYNQQNELDVSPDAHPFRSEEARAEGRNVGVQDPGPGAAATPAAGNGAVTRDEANRSPNVANHETEVNWNYAVIERLDKVNLTTQLIPFVLKDAISDTASPQNKMLEPGDVVVVYSGKDLKLPVELQAKFVRIDGEVKNPGFYSFSQGETLRDIVKRAGGFTSQAYLYASQLVRESERLQQEARMRDFLQLISQQAFSPANMLPNGPTDKGTDPGAELEIRRAYLARLADVHPTGRVVLHVKPQAVRVEDIPDFQLQDGDRFFVPAIPNTVDVLGNVYNMGALLYEPGEKMGRYLDSVGGATREGDRKREFILRADGTVISRQSQSKLEKLVIYPGDAIVVPPLLKANSSIYQLLNWTQIVSAFALSALAIKGLQ